MNLKSTQNKRKAKERSVYCTPFEIIYFKLFKLDKKENRLSCNGTVIGLKYKTQMKRFCEL